MPKMLGIMVGMDRKNCAGIIGIPQVQYLDNVDGYFYGLLYGGWMDNAFLVSQKISFCIEGSFTYTATAWTLCTMVVGWATPFSFHRRLLFVPREVSLTPQQTKQPVAIPQVQFLDKVMQPVAIPQAQFLDKVFMPVVQPQV